MHKTWLYEKEFQLEENSPYSVAILDCEGLDTLATVSLNGKEVGKTINQFRHYLLDVKDVLQSGTNTLHIQFDPAIENAQKVADAYPYYVRLL